MTNNSASTHNNSKRVSLSHLQKMKRSGEKIAMLTAYDATFSHLLSTLGIDIILVGDSLGLTIAGHDTTVPVTMTEMVYHIHNVCRSKPRCFIVGDLPFLSYTTVEKALENAGSLMQAGAQMVKLEGDNWLLPIVGQLSEKGIPVCVHLGLTPQSVYFLGGYKVQGRDPQKAEHLLHSAQQLESAGAKMLVLECVPYPLAQKITQAVSIPVIGIGAGPYCDGQVLVLHDMLGLNPQMQLSFVKDFLTGETTGIAGAIKQYISQVKSGEFPSLEQSFT